MVVAAPCHRSRGWGSSVHCCWPQTKWPPRGDQRDGWIDIISTWLVVLTILEKYESQWEGLSHILWKIKNVPNHQSATIWLFVT